MTDSRNPTDPKTPRKPLPDGESLRNSGPRRWPVDGSGFHVPGAEREEVDELEHDNPKEPPEKDKDGDDDR